MAALYTRASLLSLCLFFTLIVLLHYPGSKSSWDSLTQLPGKFTNSSEAKGVASSLSTLSVFSKIYVVSLPHRTDRREEMERLRKGLGLEWTYFPATHGESEVVSAIMQRVRTIREECAEQDCASAFAWPEDDVDATSRSAIPLALWNSDFLIPADILSLSKTWLERPQDPPLECARSNFSFPKDKKGKPSCLLTPGKVACWHSHLSVIQRVANLGAGGSTLILEDDVDMESDIHTQLSVLWPSLPTDWDIVFLGHCWSDESKSEPLSGPNPNFPTFSLLYPSLQPRCTHAYALSHTGARRLLLYLQYAPFAYSREIDRAIALLIERKLLKAFSIVPSIVVQRKLLGSDVWGGKGSRWKDELRKGVLE